MPLQVINLRPGVNKVRTPTSNSGGYTDSSFIRFFAGLLQKCGGWSSIPGIAKLVGICRGLFGWADLSGTAHLAIGTEQRLSVLTGGVLTDITPIVRTSDIAPALATVLGSNVVTVTDAGYSPAAGDWVQVVTWTARGGLVVRGFHLVASSSAPTFTITAPIPATSTQASGGAVPAYATTAGSAIITVGLPLHGLSAGSVYQATVSTVVSGLTIFGMYVVNTVIDANNFQITASALAAGIAVVFENAGNMRLQYLLPSGVAVNTAAGGWGAGDYGAGDWGGSAVGAGSPVNLLRTWSLDHFGQDLIASPNLGKIYVWDPATALPATLIAPGAPIISCVVFTIAQAQIIMSAGSEALGTAFPTLVRWCDSGDFTAWVATTTNQAGSYQLSAGSYIEAAMAVGLGALIWTDVDLWSVQYQGLPFVFSFNRIAVNCEAISKKAPAAFAQSVVWPSTKTFFLYAGGSVQPIDCPVWDYFYDNLDPQQTDSVFSAVNTLFDEISWYFTGIDGIVRYIKMNYGAAPWQWDIGVRPLTAWTDHSPYGNPIGSDNLGTLFEHELVNDADGAPLISFGQSGYYQLGNGDMMQVVKVLIPDFVASPGANIQLTVLATDYPGDPPRTYGPFMVTPTTKRVNVSLRGRQIAFRIGSSDLGSFWRVGAIRYSTRDAGSRP